MDKFEEVTQRLNKEVAKWEEINSEKHEFYMSHRVMGKGRWVKDGRNWHPTYVFNWKDYPEERDDFFGRMTAQEKVIKPIREEYKREYQNYLIELLTNAINNGNLDVQQIKEEVASDV